MSVFKKTVTVNGKYKAIAVTNGEFVDYETGEVIDLAEQLENIYGDAPFSLTTSNKVDTDLE